MSTTSPLALTLMPVAFVSPMPVSSSGKDAIENVEAVLDVSVLLVAEGGSISKLSKLPRWLTRTKFVPETDATVI
ncbi:hypothetical protein [Microcoleus sp. Pol12A6]|uniref:hypothetical protein n=1 Tax=Microcoleus sp. Pol12A6 TaxID=3055393 RepID=UPI002FD61ECF